MGKKGKKSKKKRSAGGVSEAAPSEENSMKLQVLTIEQIRALPIAPNRVWGVKTPRRGGSLQVVEVSGPNQGQSEVRVGRCRIDDSDTAIQIIFNAMVNPTCKADHPSAGPMRPRFLLVHPKLKVSYAKIKQQVELTGVPVRLHEEPAYSFVEATDAAKFPIDRQATFYDGFSQGPTAAIVKEVLPLKNGEIWKARLLQLRDGRDNISKEFGLIVIEDVTTQPIAVVGQGTIRLYGLAEAIMATMLSPGKGKEGVGDPWVAGEPRRPGLLLLDEGLEPCIKLLEDALLGSDVKVKMHDARSNLCGNKGCYKVERPDDLLDCPCKQISYCSRECQLAHHEMHKRNCSWYQKKKQKKEREAAQADTS